MIDTEPIIRLAQQLADEITAQVDDAETTAFVRQAMVCVEIDLGNSTTIFSVSADDRPWVQIAFLDAAANNLDAARCEVNDDD